MADWQNNLDSFFTQTNEENTTREVTPLERFIRDVAIPAFNEMRTQMEKHGRELTVRQTVSSVTAQVHYNGNEELSYRLHERLFPNGPLPYAEVRFRERKGLKILRVESMLRSGQPDYRIEDLEKEEVIKSFLDHYMRAVKPG